MVTFYSEDESANKGGIVVDESAPTTSQQLFADTLSELKEKGVTGAVSVGAKMNVNGHWVRKGKRVRGPQESWAIRKVIKGSPKKANIVARLIRGLSYEKAVIQLTLCSRRIAMRALGCLKSAYHNATHNHKLDGKRLVVGT